MDSIKNRFTYLLFFYHHLGYRVIVVMILNVGIGVLDGLGLSMFLPLLNLASGEATIDVGGSWNMSILVSFLSSIGIPFTLVGVLLFMCFFFILKGLLVFTHGTYEAVIQQYFIRKVRLLNINNLNAISFKHFIRSDVGQIQNTLTGEVDRVSRAFSFYFSALQSIIMIAVYMLFAVAVDGKFALLVSLGGLASNWVFKVLYTRTRNTSRNLTTDSNFFQGLIIQHVANFKYLKATGTIPKYSRKLVEAVYRIERSNRSIGILSAVMKGAREPLIIVVVSGVIIVQTNVLGSPLGPILVSLLFFYRALSALMLMQNSWNLFLSTSGSIGNMIDFSKSLVIGKEQNGKISVHMVRGQLELKDATFSYNGDPVLQNINLRISKNETVAFVGESGSGKTTLVSILAGLMPLDSGEFIIDGVNSNEVNLSSYQRRVGYITQDPVIFNDSVYNNVTLWADAADINWLRFKDAIRRASLSDFLNQLGAKEHTMLGNDGINLSGGQKQRISIARELFKDLDVLILDEATAALDSETERAIQDNIDELKGKCTILVVAHRLSTVRNADTIVFMHQGKIVHVGNFQEMMSTVPAFERMVKLQTV